MITADFHNHTEFSTDSDTPVQTSIERAVSMGLKKLCITDHMDRHYPENPEGIFEFEPDAYFKTLLAWKERFSDRIEVLIGIELGLRNETGLREEIRDFYDRLTADYPFDFVIGSTHVLNYTDPYLPSYWETRTLKDGLADYFQSITVNTGWYSCFDVYGHLDYILRYAPNGPKDYRCEDYADLIDEALKALIAAGKGIEVNTAGLKSLSFPHPKQEILRRYRELGGEIVTIGSDAHKPEYLGFRFDEAAEYLKECGFRYYTTFRKRKPVFELL